MTLRQLLLFISGALVGYVLGRLPAVRADEQFVENLDIVGQGVGDDTVALLRAWRDEVHR